MNLKAELQDKLGSLKGRQQLVWLLPQPLLKYLLLMTHLIMKLVPP